MISRIMKSRSVLLQIILFVGMILFIVIGIVIFLFQKTYLENYKENKISACVSVMERAEMAVDTEVRLLEQSLEDFFVEKNVVSEIVSGGSGENESLLSTIIQVQDISGRSSWFDEVYLYIYAGDFILDSNGKRYIWMESDSVKSTFQQYFDQRTKKDTDERVIDVLAMEDGVYMFHNFPVSRSITTMALRMNSEKLAETMASCMGEDFFDSCRIYDENWKCIMAPEDSEHELKNWVITQAEQKGNTYVGKMETTQGTETAVAVTSDVTGWTYLCLLSQSQLFPASLQFFYRLIPAIAILFLVIILLAVWMIRKVYMPLRSILRMMEAEESQNSSRPNSMDISEYDRIGSIYRKTQEQKGRMKEMLMDVSSAVNETVLKNLLLGEGDTNVLMEDLRQMGSVLVEDGRYLVLCLQHHKPLNAMGRESESELDFSVLVKRTEDFWKKRCQVWTIHMNTNEYVFLLRYSEGYAAGQVKRELKEYEEQWEKMTEKGNNQISIGVSSVVQSISDLTVPYSEACEDNRRRWYYQGQQEDLDHLSQEPELLYYKNQYEMIWKEIESGNGVVQDMEKLLKKAGELDSGHKKQMIGICVDILTEKMMEMTFSDNEKNYSSRKTELEKAVLAGEPMETLWERFVELNSFCIHQIQKYMQKEQYRHMENAKKYIRQIYSDPGISLETVSSHLGISASYLSALFSEYTSQGFVDYLNCVRLEKAKQMIVETKLTVAEIGYKVGFNSPQNFNRVFKRYCKMTPGKYRETYNKEEKQ
ncbi:MAG: AraC family transcriptional regulator [Clostridiales bacterium]|nr:AraC family transcriptional regulator [Clostridiales bacterium]